ncbi:MAG TPA: phenylalanine--tRNA ligase subunit beta [Gaiellaceae bacterium]|jgi:phenylalanyl-tRNA synthetase beta chain|nr:phenylalanine--tRNA ligase subunit beta [Gaiellaceae bacterium]
MRVPVSWLRDYVPLEMPLPELAERLSISTAEVEGIERRGVPDENGNLGLFRVGRVVEAAKHPNADRLQLCRVDIGEAEPRQIVCGAWNFGAGATVAVALPGALLPGGLELEQRKVRGELSDGMILAEDEVALGTDHSGIMVLPETEPGTPLGDVLPLVEEVLLVESTGNRPDLLSIYGLAREIAALYELELAPMPGRDPEPAGDEPADVVVEDFEGCPRYIGRLFRDVEIGPSPIWLKTRLLNAGMRPISNVVDVTNYVMLALGNPLHAFDLTTLKGGKIIVRRARPGETLRTLDGVERELEPGDLLIADEERGVALAGIMGGEETEIGEPTSEVLLEAANFEPTTIFRSSERLRLRTEGSNRWEKGVDPYLAEPAAKLATQLLVETAGARWVGHTDVNDGLPERPAIRYRPERADELIGIPTAPAEQAVWLERLGFEHRNEEVVTPTWRAREVTREVDVVEEIARKRLEDVPFTLPARREMFGALTPLQRVRRRVEDVLVGLGLTETYTPSLRPDDPDPRALRLPEPISAELAVLRTRLLPSLVEAARRNVELGAEGIALFEVARVYRHGDNLPDERVHVAAIVEGGWNRAKGLVETLYAALNAEPGFERANDELFHPGKAASLGPGLVGELHPAVLEGVWGAFELDLAALLAEAHEDMRYTEVASFPALHQDLAFAVPEEVSAAELAEAAREAAGPELRAIRPFDVYRGEQVGEGRKSVAFAVSFQSAQRTLTDEDAAALREKIVAALRERFGAELRA